MKTSQKIIEYINKSGQVTAKDLTDFLDISDRAVRKQLKSLYQKNILTKIGKPPKVFYSIKKKTQDSKIDIDTKVKKFIDDNYLIITPRGEQKIGLEGFVYWCQKNNLEVSKTAEDYIKTFNKYSQFKKEGLINGLKKFKSTFKQVYLDKLYYIDFYSIERFGKTKLGQMLLYGKQSGNKQLIKEIVKDIKPEIEKIIKKNHINAVGFIPWTVKRETQFMKEFEKGLNLNVKNISIEKIKTEVIVPQKTLPKLNDRVENVANTIVVNEQGQYNNILLIDDAVGSGATLNETAKQIKEKGIGKKVIGLSITGSFKGFDVISEV
ncbi:DeoR family transcriptional regulator [Patescibacteria group bacterium]|nr:DeoR family transcriptional regulator [Patescibacteria group bacterium]